MYNNCDKYLPLSKKVYVQHALSINSSKNSTLTERNH